MTTSDSVSLNIFNTHIGYICGNLYLFPYFYLTFVLFLGVVHTSGSMIGYGQCLVT